jgi:hypothetical protein
MWVVEDGGQLARMDSQKKLQYSTLNQIQSNIKFTNQRQMNKSNYI